LWHVSNIFRIPGQEALAERLTSATFADVVFFTNSGTEAVECALKTARKFHCANGNPERIDVIGFDGAFHGRSYAAVYAAGNPHYTEGFGPALPGYVQLPFGDMEALEAALGPSTAAVIIEPVQGEGGARALPEADLTRLRALCDEEGALLIYDEIQCGLGRSGRFWTHADLPQEAHPDIITTAKALGNGFPVGATVVNEFVSSRIAVGDHGTTFGGNPLASRVAHHIVGRLSEPQLLNGVAIKEKLFRAHFERLRSRWPDVVTEIRGRGLILGLQLNQDPVPIITAARERGLLVISAGTSTLRFVPPLVISESEIESGMKVLEDAMESVLEK
jgi:acetylornithine/succinyldiaminopimelate/putrescine aminotransferase